MSASPDDAELVDAFWSVARQLRGSGADAFAEVGLTPGNARALRVLLRHGAMRPGQLSRSLRIAPRSATEVIDALAEHGLVERHPDPADRRATLIEVTAKGERTGERLGELRRAQTQQMFAALSVTDRAQLTRILRKLAD